MDTVARLCPKMGIPGINCDDGLLVPLWSGTREMSLYDMLARGIIYFLVLLYIFLGIAIYLNKLMESMETMTSLMKRVSVPDPETGKNQVIIVKIWNQTLANMFMVLGSFSPLIWIALLEVIGKGYYAGDIGPFTIMGSSAFNLFVAIGVSNSVVPKVQGRMIKNTPGTAGGPGGRDRTLAVKSRKNVRKITFFS